MVESYLGLLNNYSEEFKLELISKISQSIKANSENSKKLFYSSFGAWESIKTPDEIISEIRKERKFTRKTEEF